MSSKPEHEPRLHWTTDRLPAVSEADEPAPVSLVGSLAPEEVRVVFQPIVDLKNGRTFAHEALVRCTRPDLKSPPVLFDRAVAEGSCGRLGRLIRESATSAGIEVPLFLNVHPDELAQRWLVRPDDPMFQHECDVYLEITESVPFSHHELCLKVLQELRARPGIRLVVDDLGAGYSNLKYIVDLEPDVVKLDRQLVAGLDKSERQQRLVKSVVSLCHDLGAKVVAEGIETQAELEASIDAGADYGQGYLLARPAHPAPDVTAGLFGKRVHGPKSTRPRKR
jgi:EAL domain-containing protein (putative c-di-GMP-specific phosphodiesterase class I)